MPKDGQGSSSSFVEVEFEHQRQRTSVKHKDLNPVWNERLVFAVSDPADLPYRAIDVGVYNERSSASSRNFLGRVRISAAGVPAPGEEPVPQLFSLEKRSLFSHIRGEISLKIYRAHANDIREAGGNQTVAKVKEVGPELHPSGRKQQQHQQQPVGGQVRHQHHQQQQQQQQRQNNQGQMQHPQQGKQHQPMGPPFPVDFKPVVLTAGPPVRPDLYPAGVGAGMGAPFPGANTNPRQEFSLKETRPHLCYQPLGYQPDRAWRLGGSAIAADWFRSLRRPLLPPLFLRRAPCEAPPDHLRSRALLRPSPRQHPSFPHT